MSRNTLAALALLALAAPAHAADAPATGEPAPEYSLTANVTLASQYRYRGLMQTNNIGMSSAAGVYQSVVGFILVISANLVVRKVDESSALF